MKLVCAKEIGSVLFLLLVSINCLPILSVFTTSPCSSTCNPHSLLFLSSQPFTHFWCYTIFPFAFPSLTHYITTSISLVFAVHISFLFLCLWFFPRCVEFLCIMFILCPYISFLCFVFGRLYFYRIYFFPS